MNWSGTDPGNSVAHPLRNFSNNSILLTTPDTAHAGWGVIHFVNRTKNMQEAYTPC